MIYMSKVNAKFLYDLGKGKNKFYKDFKELLKLYVEDALQHGLAQFVLHADEFQEVLKPYNKRSLYKIDLIENLEEWTFKGLQDLFKDRFVVDVRLSGSDGVVTASPRIFIHLLDEVENPKDKKHLEKVYKMLVKKYS